MSRIFKNRGITATGKILPIEEFKFFIDMDSPKLSDEKMQRVVKSAEEYLSEEIPFLPLSLYREFFINGNRTHYQDPCFKRRRMALALAFAEYYERSGRFTEKLCDVVWAILEETSWIIPAHTGHSPTRPGTDVPEAWNERRMHGIDLFSASTASILTTVYYLLKDEIGAVSPLICERMEYEVLQRSIVPYLSRAFTWSGDFGRRPNNWCPWIVSNILFIAAVMVSDPYDRTAVVNKALNHLDNFTNLYPEDGGCDEGPSYWGAAGASYFDCLELIYDMTGGAIDVFDEPLVKAMGEYEAKFNINGVRFINFADCGCKVNANGTLMARYGRRTGSPMLEAFGINTSFGNTHEPTTNHSYRALKDLMTPPYAEKIPTRAEKNTIFPDLKVMISRQSERTDEGMFLAIKGGNNAESHNHNDVGSFIVYKDGEPVLIDAGVGTYTKQTFSSRRYELWFMQSEYHNLPTVDGVGEMQGGAFKSENEVYDEKTGSYTLELAAAYKPEAGIRSFIRSAVLTDGKASVTDTLCLDKEREIDFHFMTYEEPKLIKPGEISLPMGRRLIYDSDLLTPEIEEFHSEGLNAKSAWGNENLYRIHLKSTAKNLSTTFVIE